MLFVLLFLSIVACACQEDALNESIKKWQSDAEVLTVEGRALLRKDVSIECVEELLKKADDIYVRWKKIAISVEKRGG